MKRLNWEKVQKEKLIGEGSKEGKEEERKDGNGKKLFFKYFIHFLL